MFGYLTSINENRYLRQGYQEISEPVWMFARGGQGDELFIDKERKEILFYEHDVTECSGLNHFSGLGIIFDLFIVLCDLYRQLKQALDTVDLSEFEKVDSWRM